MRLLYSFSHHNLHNSVSRYCTSDIYLTKEVPCEVFLEDAFFCDEVKEVLARLGSLHDNDEGVMALKVVQ